MKNKKLLFLCPSYPSVGGVEAVTSLMVDFFLEKGFDVFILVSSVKEIAGASLVKHLDKMSPMQGVNNSVENLSFIDAFILKNEIACVFNQGAFSEAYLHTSLHKDVIFINTLHSCPFWEVKQFRYSTLSQLFRVEKNAFNKIKVFVRFILNRIKPGMSNPSIDSFYKRQIDSVTYYVVLDQAYKRTLENKLYGGVTQDKILVIPDPLLMPKETLLQKQKKVLYVGRLTGEPKRVDRLLRIWKKIQLEVSDWELQIIGDGDQRETLEKLSAQLLLTNVTFLGFQNPIPYYESASILCLTSTYEGFGMVLTEAQSFGTVPVSFRCSDAIGRIIDHEVDGMIIEPFDEDCFAGKLLYLMKNDSLRAQMSVRAREKASEFDIEKIGPIWLDLLK